MQKKNRLFKPYISFLSKKTKNSLSYDFQARSLYGFLKFRCFWNFANFKSYFRSFNKQVQKKKKLNSYFLCPLPVVVLMARWPWLPRPVCVKASSAGVYIETKSTPSSLGEQVFFNIFKKNTPYGD